MKNLIHLVYIPWTGLGIQEYKGDAWFAYRIELFRKYVLPSLYGQREKDFVLWNSFRKEERDNPLIKKLKYELNKTEIKSIMTFDGIMMHDDRGLQHNEDLEERMEKSLKEVHDYFWPPIATDETYVQPEWVYKTDLGSDDMLSVEAIEEIQKVEPKERAAAYYINGYVMDMENERIAEWNRDSSCSKYTVIYPYKTFFDAKEHFNYIKGLESHELLPQVFKAVRLPDRRYMAGVHRGNISTTWDNKFRGKQLNDIEKKEVLNQFGL